MSTHSRAMLVSKGNLPFGAIQGYAPGNIPAFSNLHDHYFSGERSIDGNLFCGFKYQCVEFARRWLFERKGLILPDVSWAVHIFQLKEVLHAETAQPAPCATIRNGTTEKPTADTLLIYPSAEDAIVGHVAAITEVGDDFVRIADQNRFFGKWPGDYASQLKLSYKDNLWTIIDDTEEGVEPSIPIGWVTFPGVPDRDTSKPILLHPSLHFKAPPKPYLNRVTFTPTKIEENWLDLTNPAQALFVKTFGMDVRRTRLEEMQTSYYEMNQELHLSCVRYGTQLHEMFLKATERVIGSDEMLSLFAIPEELWPRLRHSWETQRVAITGRFDFAFNNETGEFKCFEYNADSASTLLECGVIQQLWAESVGLDVNSHTRSAGFNMSRNLTQAWANASCVGKVHFLVDDDDEEKYTALYCMEGAKNAGLETKLCVMLDEFKFNEEGHVVDSDNVRVRNVWKTWMWETAISDYYKRKEERGPHWKPKKGEQAYLSDILLGSDWDVRVFEPMWKLIPSNKAILPLIYEENPNHPAVLPASYTITEELKASGYAKKPIVGRVGRNVTITNSSGSVEATSDGNFGERNMIYQRLFPLTQQDGYYSILGGWILGDSYSGTGVREDKSIITGLDSPFAAVRIKVDTIPRPLTASDLDKMADDE